MQQFGTLFKISVFGESHGPLVGVTIDGVPPGLSIDTADFLKDLNLRKGGMQKGTTPRKEDDEPQIVSGVFNNFSTGFPITILFENKNVRSGDYEATKNIPRPGHADFVAHEKFKGFEDYRGGGHFSARLTVGIVAAGVIAKKIIEECHFDCKVINIGGCTDIDQGLQNAIDAKDSVGGIIECVVSNMPIGWGEPFWNSIESLLAHAMFSIPAVKGIEFGAGFKAAAMFGSEHNDAIINASGTTLTNHAGGMVGGISNGNNLVFRLVVKPTASTPKPQMSYDKSLGQLSSFSVKGRHDLCVALRAPVIVEAMAAIVLADFKLQHLARS